MMKKQYIAPVLALVIVATWLIYLRASTASINRDNIAREASINRDNIEREKMLRSSGKSSDALRANSRTKKTQVASSDALDTSDLESTRDWKKLSLALLAEGEAQGNTGKPAIWLRLQKILAEMSNDELIAAYHEINVLPSRPINRWHLEDEMLKILEWKNPEFAFSQHIARFENNDKITSGIARFSLWLERDPAAATAWYESEVAKGTFDKNLDNNPRLRQPFEAGFIRSLLTSDPAAAERRMNQIPPDQRKELVVFYLKASENDPKALIDLIRKTVSKEEQTKLVALKVIDPIHLKNTARVLQNLARINATQEERSTLLQMEVLKDVNFKTFDGTRMKQYREWALAIDPSSADRTTGLAFAQYAKNHRKPEEYEYITKLAIDYHGMGAGDDFIIGVVEGSGTGRATLPLENARALAMKISDQTRRNEILKKLQ